MESYGSSNTHSRQLSFLQSNGQLRRESPFLLDVKQSRGNDWAKPSPQPLYRDKFFNPETNPPSPNRPMLFAGFLQSKLGEERFQKALALIRASPNPIVLLEGEGRQQLVALIGEDNADCLKVFKFLVNVPPA